MKYDLSKMNYLVAVLRNEPNLEANNLITQIKGSVTNNIYIDSYFLVTPAIEPICVL